MKQTSLLMHIVMIVFAVAIGYLYIFPTVQIIRENQDTAVVFNQEVSKVSSVNSQLQQKLTAINNIPTQDKQKLVTYMPDKLDEISILRTMESILMAVNIKPSSLEFAGGNKTSKEGSSNNSALTEITEVMSDSKTVKSVVSVSFETDEQTLLNFFSAIKSSSLPFVVRSAKLSPTETALVSAELDYEVYALVDESAIQDSTSDTFGTDNIDMLDGPNF